MTAVALSHTLVTGSTFRRVARTVLPAGRYRCSPLLGVPGGSSTATLEVRDSAGAVLATFTSSAYPAALPSQTFGLAAAGEVALWLANSSASVGIASLQACDISPEDAAVPLPTGLEPLQVGTYGVRVPFVASDSTGALVDASLASEIWVDATDPSGTVLPPWRGRVLLAPFEFGRLLEKQDLTSPGLWRLTGRLIVGSAVHRSAEVRLWVRS